jgi:hypothetical protein
MNRFRMMDLFLNDGWTSSWTRGEVIDTTKFDVINGEKVPRKDYKEKLLRQKEEELKALEDYYEKRKSELREERKRLAG